MANPRPLRDFVQAVTKEPREAELLATVQGHLASLVARDDWLPDEMAQPPTQFYRRYPLHAHPLERFLVVCFAWGLRMTSSVLRSRRSLAFPAQGVEVTTLARWG
jgi:predicted metal-dependent enzyme (double-stranded beta helix superfamily)